MGGGDSSMGMGGCWMMMIRDYYVMSPWPNSRGMYICFPWIRIECSAHIRWSLEMRRGGGNIVSE